MSLQHTLDITIKIEPIDKGVRLLNERYPDWKKEINLNTLDLNSSQNCVLGQLYGSYPNGVGALSLWDNDHDYGFSLEYKWEDDIELDVKYEKLTEQWKKRIEGMLNYEKKRNSS